MRNSVFLLLFSMFLLSLFTGQEARKSVERGSSKHGKTVKAEFNRPQLSKLSLSNNGGTRPRPQSVSGKYKMNAEKTKLAQKTKISVGKDNSNKKILPKLSLNMKSASSVHKMPTIQSTPSLNKDEQTKLSQKKKIMNFLKSKLGKTKQSSFLVKTEKQNLSKSSLPNKINEPKSKLKNIGAFLKMKLSKTNKSSLPFKTEDKEFTKSSSSTKIDEPKQSLTKEIGAFFKSKFSKTNKSKLPIKTEKQELFNPPMSTKSDGTKLSLKKKTIKSSPYKNEEQKFVNPSIFTKIDGPTHSLKKKTKKPSLQIKTEEQQLSKSSISTKIDGPPLSLKKKTKKSSLQIKTEEPQLSKSSISTKIDGPTLSLKKKTKQSPLSIKTEEQQLSKSYISTKIDGTKPSLKKKTKISPLPIKTEETKLSKPSMFTKIDEPKRPSVMSEDSQGNIGGRVSITGTQWKTDFLKRINNDQIKNEPKTKILVLSGTHGDKKGNSLLSKLTEKETGFFQEDKSIAKALGSNQASNNINMKIVDMNEYHKNPKKLKQLMDDFKPTKCIHAFCHSAKKDNEGNRISDTFKVAREE